MPATSARQYRAMQAAAHGHSTLGIPSSVGKEFADATPDPKALPATAAHPLAAMKARLTKLGRGEKP